MENSEVGALQRNMRFGSHVDANSGTKSAATPSRKVAVRGHKALETNDLFAEEDGLFVVMISWARIVVYFLSMIFTAFTWAVIMVVLLPWPYQRIRQGNIFGHATGKMLMPPVPAFIIFRINGEWEVLLEQQAANAIVKNGLFDIFPEGTPSKNGRLLPSKNARSINFFSIVLNLQFLLLLSNRFTQTMHRVLCIWHNKLIC